MRLPHLCLAAILLSLSGCDSTGSIVENTLRFRYGASGDSTFEATEPIEAADHPEKVRLGEGTYGSMPSKYMIFGEEPDGPDDVPQSFFIALNPAVNGNKRYRLSQCVAATGYPCAQIFWSANTGFFHPIRDSTFIDVALLTENRVRLSFEGVFANDYDTGYLLYNRRVVYHGFVDVRRNEGHVFKWNSDRR